MSLTQITRTVVSSISSFFNINNTTGAITSVIPDLMPSNATLYPSFACRAWVNFDGTRDTTGASSTANTNRLIRGSGNVLSVLRNGTGIYTITFTTSMADINYNVIASCGKGTSVGSNDVYMVTNFQNAPLVNSVNISSLNGGRSLVDVEYISVAIFR